MFNFVLCFDENYNKIAQLFLHTLLGNVSEKVNIFIIHNDPDSMSLIKDTYQNHKNIEQFSVYKFDKDLSIFPDITHGHISEATYYRLFLDSYLPKNLDYIFYVDADIICHKDPIPLLKSEIKRLKKSEYLMCARTEVDRIESEKYGQKPEPHMERLNLKGNRYLNAGVLLIDYQQWLNKNISKKLYTKLKNYKEILIYWDQDLLNMVVDDQYLELDRSLNFPLFINSQNNLSPLEHFGQKALDDMSLLHYTGSIKPWTVRGSFNKKSIYFHDAYFNLYNKKYMIKNTWRVSAIQELIKGILKLHIKNLRYPFSFIFIVFRSLLKKID